MPRDGRESEDEHEETGMDNDRFAKIAKWETKHSQSTKVLARKWNINILTGEQAH